MLVIRFNRTGKNKRATFRIAVQEHTVAPGGRHVEVVGSYDPHSKKAVFKADRVKYWLEKGAQASESVHNLLVREKVIEGKKREKKIQKPAAPEAPAEETKIESGAETPASSEAPAEAKAEEVKVEETKTEEIKQEGSPENK
jgi:small subunit ribosomal protein S16